jgi:Protein of unknown function (DUF3024)
MATAVIPELHLYQITRWCQQRVPAQVRDQVSVEHRVRGRIVTIVERRPPWSPALGPEWTTMPVAQLRYAPPPPAGGRWRLYWADRNRRWHLMDDVPSRHPSLPAGRARRRPDRDLLGLTLAVSQSTTIALAHPHHRPAPVLKPALISMVLSGCGG